MAPFESEISRTFDIENYPIKPYAAMLIHRNLDDFNETGKIVNFRASLEQM